MKETAFVLASLQGRRAVEGGSHPRANLDSSQMASDDLGRFVIAISFTVHPAGTSLHNRNPLCVRLIR
jgi:hypothetical protein